MMKQHFGRGSAHVGGCIVVARFSLVTLIAVLAGCASMGGGGALTKDSPSELLQAKVQERALARWQALIDGVPERSYEYVSPASKEAISLEAYREKTKGAGVSYRKIEFDSVNCEGDTCNVKLFLWYDHRIMRGIRAPMEEVWILDKGQAWYVWRQ